MALAITHLGNAADGTNQQTYDFGDFSPAEAGLMIVVVSGFTTSDVAVSSVSIGGTNGALIQPDSSQYDRVTLCIARREVSAGDHNVTVTFAASIQVSRVSVYLLTGYDSATPSDTDFNYAALLSATATLDFPTDGIAVYGFQHDVGSSGSTTWSAATEVYDDATEARVFSSAYKTASGLGNTETATKSPSGNGRVAILGAVWAPAGGGGSILPFVNNIMLGGVI